MKKFVENLKKQAEENPQWAIGLGLGAIATMSTLMKHTTEAANARTYRKEINRRVKKSNK